VRAILVQINCFAVSKTYRVLRDFPARTTFSHFGEFIEAKFAQEELNLPTLQSGKQLLAQSLLMPSATT
jgi:hypothetical protein